MSNQGKSKAVYLTIELMKTVLCVAGLGVLYLLIFQKLGVGIPCLIHKLTGYQCPGCGMTRALAATIRGDFLSAWNYNALSITLFPILSVYLLYRVAKEKLGKDGFFAWEYFYLVANFAIVMIYGYFRNK